jgi:gas vesicle protein
MSKIWRFMLGGAIGVGIGYAAVLLVQPQLQARRRSRRLRTIYQAPAERKEETPAA